MKPSRKSGRKVRPRKFAKCRDKKKWSPAEDVNGDGVLWHWWRSGKYLTALAKKCMRRTRP